MSSSTYVDAIGIVCALGDGVKVVRERLFSSSAQPLSCSDVFSPGRVLPLGLVREALPATESWPMRRRSRANALAEAALAQIRPQVDAAIAGYGAARVAVVVGGSTSGLREGEAAVRQRRAEGGWTDNYHYAQQELGATADFLAWRLGAQGPALVISTACSSGAKALASAARLLQAGLADAVVAGGVDALCRFTVAGFSALESVSDERCNPLSRTRRGINLGEGAALFLLGRATAPLRLAGWGESSDAHHMSAPAPDGRGAIDAMRQALARAGVAPSAVGYLNLHGTATPQNDAMEAKAVAEVLGQEVAVSSTKPLTGHALGAAGAIEAAFACMTLVDNPAGRLPPHWWDGVPDPELPGLRVVHPGMALGRPARLAMSNSFAFGGSNASLLFATA
jgi:3-oxoacyl-[acyl-carrier-protein] synthase-1